jgi:hypothetical protein
MWQLSAPITLKGPKTSVSSVSVPGLGAVWSSGLGDETAVVWEDGGDAVMQLFIDNGTFVNASPELVAAPGSGEQSLAYVVALADGNFVMTWLNQSNGQAILGQIYDPSGNKVGSTLSILQASPDYVDGVMFATPDGGFGFAYEDGDTQAFQLFHANGTPNGGPVAGLSGVSGVDGAAVLTNGNIALMSSDKFEVYNPDGHPIEELPVRNAGSASGDALAALPDGRFVIAYAVIEATGNSFSSSLYATVFDGGGSVYLDEITINNNQQEVGFAGVSLAVMPDGRMIFAWCDTSGDFSSDPIEVRVIDPDGNAVSDVFVIPGSTLPVDEGDFHVTALNNTSFSVTWGDSATISNQVLTIAPPPYLPDDFLGFGTSDVLFRNTATGDTGFFDIVNGSNSGWIDIGASSTSYSVIGTGDFNGDGTDDILYRNNVTGDTGFYEILDGANAGWHDVGLSSAAYTAVGIGDFNGDGTADILYRNNATGDTGFYEIVNGANAGWHDVGSSQTAYSVVGVGDFNGDGTSDILYRNNSTGDTGFYAIVNGVNRGWTDVGASSTAYSVVGVGDFNGDGLSDILFRNNTTGDTGYYVLSNGVPNHTWHEVGVTSTAYSVVGIGDYFHDGIDDILFRNNTTGDTGYYPATGGSWHDLGTSSTAYHVT